MSIGYRELTENETTTLTAQNCSCDDWSKVLVKENFKPDFIHDATFSGEIKLGVMEKCFDLPGGLKRHSAIRNATIHNCVVGDNCLIENIQNYIANYVIEEDCFIQNCNIICVEGESTFGNNTNVMVLNETGGREVPMFDGLSAHLAYILALYRYRPLLIGSLKKLILRYTESVTSCYGTIAKGVKIVNTGTIRNVKIGPMALIDSASRLENGSINSNASDPVTVGHNTIAEDFIFCSGAHISDGSSVVRTFVGQGCHVGHQFSSHDSLFFSNCQCENGEACAIFAGPYTVTMHKSSLLIAGMFSFLNAGSGSNQSNHMYKLGPIHQGIVERGSKTTSDSYILWPAKIGAFSLVMGRHVHHSDTSNLPFSYLIENGDETYVVPGANLRSVGTIRDSQKWPKRDKRKDPEKLDFINFNLLSPYTVNKMIKGVEILNDLVRISGATSTEYSYQGTHIRNSSLNHGLTLYCKAINKFFGNSIIKRLENKSITCDDDLRAILRTESTRGCGDWLDLSGLIAPKGEISKLLTEIESEEIQNVEEIHLYFKELHNSYYDIEWDWVSQQMQQWHNVDFETITIEKIIEIIEIWKEAVVSLDKMLYEDAKKEFSLTSKIGFGVDGKERRRESDFEQVRGSFDANPFVQSVLRHIEVKSALGESVIARLKDRK